ncbi:hypothetical protein BH23BAC4_BH23BAC4_00160 [soil metagenome]
MVKKLTFYITLAAGGLLIAACRPLPPSDADMGPQLERTPQDDWWEAMAQHCGNAYAGQLAVAPEGDTMVLPGQRLVVHFRECAEGEMRLPFHIQQGPDTWDRSRTWIYTRSVDGIALNHDHRRRDGHPDTTTGYGGTTENGGSAEEQVFIYSEPTEEGLQRGWRVQIEPNVRYTGTFRGDDWRWRVDFDLTETVDLPPAPWGYR